MIYSSFIAREDKSFYPLLFIDNLGKELDEALGWQSHVDTICKKVSAGIGALKRIRSLVPRQTLLKMYDALVAPYFDYCSEV